jgi:hypothetical protein
VPFEVIERGTFATVPLQPGICSVNKSGLLLVCTEDLALVGIADLVVVMSCADTRRIALRRPRDGEDQAAFHVGGRASRRTVNIQRALRAIGLTCMQAAGRHELATKDDLLLLNLASAAHAVPKRGVVTVGGKQ